MKKRQKRTLKSTLLMYWLFAVLFPMIIIECFTLQQVYRLNYQKIDTTVYHNLINTQNNINQIIDNMAAMSQQLVLDGNVGKNLYFYFNEMDIQKKVHLMIYLREQIGTYEAANPTLANITYFMQEYPRDMDAERGLHKINPSSLAKEILPNKNQLMWEGGNTNYYGPHSTISYVADYPVISLVRQYKMSLDEGEILIYIESGYRTLEKILSGGQESGGAGVNNMDAIFVMLSSKGDILYSSNEEKVAINQKLSGREEKLKIQNTSYRAYYAGDERQWQLCALVPLKSYYSVLYETMLHFVAILSGTIIITLMISVKLWRGISLSFKGFENNIKAIGMEEAEQTIEQIGILEFDESLAVFERLRKRIESLLQRVQKQEKEKYALEVKYLLGKINPHFLNNTLDTLKWYAQERKEPEIVRFITNLNKLLFYNMNKSRTTTLASELEAVKSYVVLQKWKYEIDFFVEVTVHPRLLQIDMPRFVLQPLVENAIFHGTIPGEIKITVTLREDGRVAISILNQGKSLDEGMLSRMQQANEDLSTNGIGLQYVIRSLENRFQDRFDFQMGTLENEELVYVTMVIPYELPVQGDENG